MYTTRMAAPSQFLRVGIILSELKFDLSFWVAKLKELGYVTQEASVPVQFLRERKAIPPGVNLKEGFLLYSDPLAFEIILLRFDKLPTRYSASRISRYWKSHQQGRQLLIFTNDEDSYVIVIPGITESPTLKARILSLSDRLFRTDIDSLKTLKFIENKKEMREAFDLNFLPYQKVRDEFFYGYRDLYQKLYSSTKELIGENASTYSQRFLGRLMFLYFLQRKGWLKQDKCFVNSIKSYKDLNWIFYEGLSKEGNEGLPYLDGTLFEREEYLTPNIEERMDARMNELFNESRGFFNEYNFTVDELSHLDVEVSVDPAMIGTIFENMLPENDRGAKGTFYTPVEEVSFICRRALSAYLKLDEEVVSDGETQTFRDGLDVLLKELREKKDVQSVRLLRDKILKIKVMDPAVGSGGFLLGIMNEMLSLIREADQTVGIENDPLDYKKSILQNLYGFDIEGEAIEIAKLRLWLSFIIDRKSPETLPSLDMNLVKIGDSLLTKSQTTIDDNSRMFWDMINALRSKFIEETNSVSRARLRRELQNLQEEMRKNTGLYGGTIEFWGIGLVDIVVMNPPYVRQESIPEEKKNAYHGIYSSYRLDKKSDIYAYFLMRALKLIQSDGIVSVIASDKWLETGYGLNIQKALSSRLISIFGQPHRTFGADINSIIFTYGAATDSSSKTSFIYLDSYTSLKVRNFVSFQRSTLKPGKWFYLRAPKLFMKNIFPKLTHVLGDYSNVKFGLKTGANEFFFMRDISYEFEADRLGRLEQYLSSLGLSARTEAELRQLGLVYVENDGGERFIIEKESLQPIIRSPTELDSYVLGELNRLIFMPDPFKKVEKYSQIYIKWGESVTVSIKKGLKKGAVVKGYQNLASVSSNRPNWYNVRSIDKCQVIPNRFIHQRHFTSFSDTPILVGDALAIVVPQNSTNKKIWKFMNSTIFWFIEELYGIRMGGAALEILAGEFENMPCPDLNAIQIEIELNRKVLDYEQELKMEDRKALDRSVLNTIGSEETDLEELYLEFEELIEDRLVKGSNYKSSKEVMNE